MQEAGRSQKTQWEHCRHIEVTGVGNQGQGWGDQSLEALSTDQPCRAGAHHSEEGSLPFCFRKTRELRHRNPQSKSQSAERMELPAGGGTLLGHEPGLFLVKS